MENYQEKKLWTAVLEAAILDLKKGNKLIFRQTKGWFLDKENIGIGSFLWICDNIGFDPDFFLSNIQEKLTKNV